MTEIRGAAPLPTAATSRPANAAAELALKALQPLQGLLAPGEGVDAEVVEVKPGSPDFQLVLRLTLAQGREARVSVGSSSAPALGTALRLTAMPQDRLLASLQPAALQPLLRLPPSDFPPGTSLQARVLGSQALPGGAFRVLVNLLNTPLAGTRLLIDSAEPLPAGSLLTAEVRGDRSLALIAPGGRLDQLALAQQLGHQFARQGSLPALFAALQAGPELPPGVRAAAEQLLGLLPSPADLADPRKLAQAVAGSGGFLESGLLGRGPEALPNDLKAALLKLVAQLAPNLPGASPLAAAQTGQHLGQALPAFARQMLDALGGGGRQQAQAFPLPARLLANLGEEADLESLLKLAAAAISRLQTHQLSSLAQTQTTPDGLQLTTWQVEIPMRDGNGVVPLQAWVQREEEGSRERTTPRETLWRIELAFDLAPLGALQVQAQLCQGLLSSHLWAEHPETAAMVDRELPHLRQRLESAGLTVGELDCRPGLPSPGARTTLQQRFVDETA